MNNGQLINSQAFQATNKSIANIIAAQFKDSSPIFNIYLDPNIYRAVMDRSLFKKLGIRIDNSGTECGQIASLKSNPKGQFWVATDCADDKGKLVLDDKIKWLTPYVKQLFMEWSDTDVRCAINQNINLFNRLQQAVLDVYFAELLEAVFTGIWDNKTDSNIQGGLFNAPEFKGATPLPAITISSLGTPEKTFAAVSNFIITNNAKLPDYYANYQANVVVVPMILWQHLASTMFVAGSGITVLAALAQAFPDVSFIPTQFHTRDKAPKTYMVAFNNNNGALVLRVPMPLRYSMPLQTKGFCWRIDAKYAIAGLDVMLDNSGSIVEVKA